MKQFIFLLVSIFTTVGANIEIFNLAKPLVNGTDGVFVKDLHLATFQESKGIIVKASNITVDLVNGKMVTKSTSNGQFPYKALSCVQVQFVTQVSNGMPTVDFETNVDNDRNALVIFNDASQILDIDEDTLNKLAQTGKVLIGAFDRWSLKLEQKFHNRGFVVIQNLDKPKGIDLTKKYWAYLFFYDAFTQNVPLLTSAIAIENNSAFPFCNESMFKSAMLSHSYALKDRLWPDYKGNPISLENGGKLHYLNHYGTHVDAPLHFYSKGKTLGGTFNVVPCVKINCHHITGYSQLIKTAEVEQWERQTGRKIPKDALVFFETGLDRYWNISQEQYGKYDASGRPGNPGVAVETARWLVDERQITGLGIDAFSYDVGNSHNFPVHIALATARIQTIGLENLANLNEIPDASGVAGNGRYYDPVGHCLLVYPNIPKGSNGSPVAVFAHFEKRNSIPSSASFLRPILFFPVSTLILIYN